MEFSIFDTQQFCARFYDGAQLLITPYNYTTTFPSIASAVESITNLVVLSNGDFVCTGVSHTVLESSGSSVLYKPAPTLRLQIEDTGSNEKFFNDPVAIENISSNGVGYRPFDYPRFISGQTSLKFSLSNYNEATTYPGVDVTLNGVLVRVFG